MTKQNAKTEEKEEKKEGKGKKNYYAYPEAKVICSCGNVLKTGSTEKEMHVEICSACHPFYTGEQRFVDAGSRIQRFQKKQADAATYKAKKKVEKKEESAPKTLREMLEAAR